MVLNFLQNNILFYIFIFVYGIYFFCKKTIKGTQIPFSKNSLEFIKNLDYYYLYNPVFGFFAIFLYFIFYTLIFLYLRLETLGSTNIVNLTMFSNQFIFNIIIILFTIRYYLKILDIIFHPYVLRLHFYLYQKTWYIALNDFFVENNMVLTSYIIDFNIFIKNWSLKESVIFSKKMQKNICKITLFLFDDISIFISRFVYYIPYSIVLITIIYDVFNNKFYYIYYALFYFFITNCIKKITKFFHEKDCLYDKRISDYFYNNSIPYKEILEKLIMRVYSNPTKYGVNTQIILSTSSDLINYFRENLKVYFVNDPVNRRNQLYLSSKGLRMNIILLLLLGNYFYFYNKKKYVIFLSFIEQEYSLLIILLPCLCLTFFVQHYILFAAPAESETNHLTVWVENKNYKVIFYILVVLQAIIILFIMLKNKLGFYSTHVIVDFYCLKIREEFTIQEKLDYFSQYLDFLILSLNENDLEYWIMLKNHLISKIELLEKTTLNEIQQMAESYIYSWSTKDDILSYFSDKREK